MLFVLSFPHHVLAKGQDRWPYWAITQLERRDLYYDHYNIALNQLRLSPLNGCKSKRQHNVALADDIAVHGLIHNLVAYKNGKGFAVVAGGRRLEAIRLLQKQDRLAADFTVPVSICSKKKAVELSLAENYSRADMQPADAIEANKIGA